MSQITTHVLDTARGAPARDMAIALTQLNSGQVIGSGRTDSDGRIADLCAANQVLAAGTYRMHFDTAGYFSAMGDTIFYPWAEVVFNIKGDGQHYHIPLLLSPFGYSTYRGS